MLFQRQQDFTRAAGNTLRCKSQAPKDAEHFFILPEDVGPHILKASFTGYLDQHLDKFMSCTFTTACPCQTFLE